MTKFTTNGQETATAGVIHPAQEMVALNNSTNKSRSIVSPGMIAAVAPILERLDECFLSERRNTRSIGLQLKFLRDGIESYLSESGKTVSDRRINGIMNHFIRVRFKIKGSRLNEYVRLGARPDLLDLGDAGDFSVSVMIEFSRLDETQLAVFLEKHPVDKLKQLQFKDIKKLVRESNGNSRNTKAKTKTPQLETQQALADSLKSTFAKVIEQVDAGTVLDKDLESALMDIAFWYLSRKRAA